MLTRSVAFARRTAPGLSLCLAVTLAAVAGDALEARLFGRAWLDALVLAILIGTAVRTSWRPPVACQPGLDFAGKTMLEIGVVLLGLAVSAQAIVGAGPVLIAGIVAIVFLAIAVSYAIGRGFGLPHEMAVLIACGNSICGNTAIAATAPVIHARGDDVAASIAFTAVLGVIVVLLLPFTAGLVGLSKAQYGIFAGLTVYSVPQVLAATAPVGALSVQVGTLVKLVRVLMLGPVILLLSLGSRRDDGEAAGPHRIGVGALVPWFILGFLAMIALRSSGVVPPVALSAANTIAGGLTIVAMAALGLSVDVRVVARAGVRVTSVVVLSLVALCVISLGLVFLLAAH